MKERNSKGIEILQYLPDDKLAEFKHMNLRARLQWLEEANAFVKKALHSSQQIYTSGFYGTGQDN